jgi:RNA methyltransferase, TrmH family
MTFKSIEITSAKNPKIKQVLQLQKPRERKNQGVFLIEGVKEIDRAYQSGYVFNSIFYVHGMAGDNLVSKYAQNTNEIFSISAALFEKLTYRGNSGGILVTARPASNELFLLKLPENPVILVLESVEKPGNLGAILRTADASGVNAIIVCDPQTDIYNPNVVRSSVGCLFTVQVAVASSVETIKYLKEKKIGIYCAALSASIPYHTVNFRESSAIVLGTEASGLSDTWLGASDQNIIIPMLGITDSLNVSTSAAILAYEALRQRGFSAKNNKSGRL